MFRITALASLTVNEMVTQSVPSEVSLTGVYLFAEKVTAVSLRFSSVELFIWKAFLIYVWIFLIYRCTCPDLQAEDNLSIGKHMSMCELI